MKCHQIIRPTDLVRTSAVYSPNFTLVKTIVVNYESTADSGPSDARITNSRSLWNEYSGDKIGSGEFKLTWCGMFAAPEAFKVITNALQLIDAALTCIRSTCSVVPSFSAENHTKLKAIIHKFYFSQAMKFKNKHALVLFESLTNGNATCQAAAVFWRGLINDKVN